jgi:hypothetical protein
LPCVTEVNRVNGPYDIIAKLSNDNNTDMIKKSIGKHMTRIRGIQSTLTLVQSNCYPYKNYIDKSAWLAEYTIGQLELHCYLQ